MAKVSVRDAIIVIFIVLVSANVATAKTTLEDSEILFSWSNWVAHTVSKGIYFVLIFLITVCLAFSTIKSKWGQPSRISSSETIDDTPNGGWVDAVYRAATGTNSNPILMSSTSPAEVTLRKLFYNKGDFHSGEDFMRVKEQLKETQHTVTLLKQELELSSKPLTEFNNDPETYRNYCTKLLVASKAKKELEESLDVLDKEKNNMEDILEANKFQGKMDMEKLKRDHAVARRELQQAVSERDQLGREVEALQREARIVASALRDNQVMDVRLEEARREIDELKRQMEEMRREKEVAVHIVEEIMSSQGRTINTDHFETTIASSLAQDQGGPLLSDHKKLAARMLAEVAKTRLEGMQSIPSELQDEPTLGDLLGSARNLGSRIHGSHGDCASERNKLKEATSSSEGMTGEDGEEDEYDEEFGDEDVEEDGDGSGNPGLVTGSPAFRKFLQTNPTFLPGS